MKNLTLKELDSKGLLIPGRFYVSNDKIFQHKRFLWFRFTRLKINKHLLVYKCFNDGRYDFKVIKNSYENYFPSAICSSGAGVDSITPLKKMILK